MNALELTGQARSHVVAVPEPPCTLHAHAVTPFLKLRRAAEAAGFDLKPVSSFRDFERQLSIWNAKFSGERPLYDAAGRALDAARLKPAERIGAILRWSALPGASRHHWGSDVDLVDANAVAPDYQFQLTVEEFAVGGPFAPLADWLDAHAARFGFFRPYRGVLSGVQAEPWHFSFAPVAERARRALTAPVLRAALAAAPLLGKEQVLARLEALHARYVAAIDWP
ncbi:MAG: M15 family metallopeptidase [Steroidobacteraceae bacterium]